MEVGWLNLLWIVQDCSLTANGEINSLEVVFLFCFNFESLKQFLIIPGKISFFVLFFQIGTFYCKIYLFFVPFLHRILRICGQTPLSETGRRCARWWKASTCVPSPSIELWATSTLETTGSKCLKASRTKPSIQSALQSLHSPNLLSRNNNSLPSQLLRVVLCTNRAAKVSAALSDLQLTDKCGWMYSNSCLTVLFIYLKSIYECIYWMACNVCFFYCLSWKHLFLWPKVLFSFGKTWWKSNYTNWTVMLFECSERCVCIKHSAKTGFIAEMFIFFREKANWNQAVQLNNL